MLGIFEDYEDAYVAALQCPVPVRARRDLLPVIMAEGASRASQMRLPSENFLTFPLET